MLEQIIIGCKGYEMSFKINSTNISDVLYFIQYNGGEIKNFIYYFPSEVAFKRVELFLSIFATPQPLIKKIA